MSSLYQRASIRVLTQHCDLAVLLEADWRQVAAEGAFYGFENLPEATFVYVNPKTMMQETALVYIARQPQNHNSNLVFDRLAAAMGNALAAEMDRHFDEEGTLNLAAASVRAMLGTVIYKLVPTSDSVAMYCSRDESTQAVIRKQLNHLLVSLHPRNGMVMAEFTDRDDNESHGRLHRKLSNNSMSGAIGYASPTFVNVRPAYAQTGTLPLVLNIAQQNGYELTLAGHVSLRLEGITLRDLFTVEQIERELSEFAGSNLFGVAKASVAISDELVEERQQAKF